MTPPKRAKPNKRWPFQFSRRRKRLHFETLEDRRVLATIMWDGGGDGTRWLDPVNWENDVLPTPVDDVVVGSQFAADTIRILPNPFGVDVLVNSIDSQAALYVEGSTFSATFSVTDDSNVAGLTVGAAGSLFIGPTGTARFDVNGPFNWIADGLGSAIGNVVSDLHVFGTVTIDGTGPKFLETTLHSYATDSAWLTTAQIGGSGTFHNYGTFTTLTNSAFGPGRFHNAPGATLIHDAAGGGNQYMHFYNLDNDGTFELLRGKVRSTSFGVSSGVFNIPAGTELELAVGETLDASSVVNVEGTLSVPGQIRMHGTINGTGTLLGRVAPLGGYFRPGGDSIGVLTIDGDYVPNAGNLDIQLGGTTAGTGHDQLVVTDQVHLRGDLGDYHLNVSLVNNHTPSAGDSYTILSGNVIGEYFTTHNLPALPSGLVWEVVLSPVEVVLNVLPTNSPPTITTTPATTATEGLLYTYDVDATDPDIGDTLTYSLDVAPTGMTIDPSSGLIQWMPSTSQVGGNSVAVRVTDSGGLFDTQSFSVTVEAANTTSTFVLTVDDPSTVGVDVIVVDNSPAGTATLVGPSTHADANSVIGATTFFGSVGVFPIAVATAVSKPLSGGTEPDVHLTGLGLSCEPGTLVFGTSDTGFSVLTPGPHVLMSPIGGTANTAAIQFVETVDLDDNQFALGSTSFFQTSQNFSTNGSFSGTESIPVNFPATPFSLTKLVSITHTAPGVSSFGAGGYLSHILGDVNQDRRFDSSDLVAMFQAGKYQANVDATFKDGDWNSDGRVHELDLVALSEYGGYESPQPVNRAEIAAAGLKNSGEWYALLKHRSRRLLA